MPTMNTYAGGDWTNYGSQASIGSLVAPTQSTYVGPVYDQTFSVATATATKLFDSTLQTGVATWTRGWIQCEVDTRIGVIGTTEADSSVILCAAGIAYPIFTYQLAQYNATFATRLAGTLQSITQLWAYHAAGSNKSVRLVLTD